MIIYRKKVLKFYLPTDDGMVEDDEEAFQDFCDFLEGEVGIDIEEVNDSIRIFSIKNKNDIDNYSTQIESPDDFGDVFDDFDPDSYPRQVFYFFIKVELWVMGCGLSLDIIFGTFICSFWVFFILFFTFFLSVVNYSTVFIFCVFFHSVFRFFPWVANYFTVFPYFFVFFFCMFVHLTDNTIWR